MPRFFIDAQPTNDVAVISGGDAHHVYSVLRMRPGEKLTCCDFFSNEYACEIAEASDERIVLSVLGVKPAASEPPFPVTLLMALPKGDKMEWIIQKAVELGVTAIRPFSSKYTVVKLDEKTAEKKVERWRKIAKSAAEQSGRGRVPEVLPPVSFASAVRDCENSPALKIICYEGETQTSLKTLLSENQRPDGIVFAVGAEGGFDRSEVDEAKKYGFRAVTLGKRILRCETAPLAVLAQFSYVFEL